MKVGLRLNGKAIGVDPTPVAGQTGDAQFPVYADRPTVGVWEEGELTEHGDGLFDFRFLAADRQLSLTPTGLESRAAGSFGGWEQVYATQQPDGGALVYRYENGVPVVVLTIEAVAS